MSDPSLEYIMKSRKSESQGVSKTNSEAKQNKSMKLSLRESLCDWCPTRPAALEASALTTLVISHQETSAVLFWLLHSRRPGNRLKSAIGQILILPLFYCSSLELKLFFSTAVHPVSALQLTCKRLWAWMQVLDCINLEKGPSGWRIWHQILDNPWVPSGASVS